MAQHIQIRGGTAAAWTTANPVLADREMGIETDTLKHKFGNGVTAWNSLSYANSGSSNYQGEWDWAANSDADPSWNPGDYGEGVGDRGVPGDSDYVADGALIFKTTNGFRYL